MNSRTLWNPMKTRTIAALAFCLALAGNAQALQAGHDVLVPAAVRGSGWVTDLFVMNPGDAAVQATVFWLVRSQPNPSPQLVSFTLLPRETRVLEDVIWRDFYLSEGEGAFRVIAKNGRVIVNSRIYRSSGEATFGQGFEGVPANMALGAASDTGQASTHIVGITSNSAYRSNFYALAGPQGATLKLMLCSPDTTVLVTKTLPPLGVFEPMLVGLSDLAEGVAPFNHGTAEVTVLAGSAVVGASRIDNSFTTADPTTLESWFECPPVAGPQEQSPAGTFTGIVSDSTGFMGGVVLVVTAEREVTSLTFSYPSDLCGATFGGSGTFTIPIPLEEFATGVTFGPSTFSIPGELAWHARLVEVVPGLLFEGTIAATGRLFTDEFVGCNGDHPANVVRLGKDPGGD